MQAESESDAVGVGARLRSACKHVFGGGGGGEGGEDMLDEARIEEGYVPKFVQTICTSV